MSLGLSIGVNVQGRSIARFLGFGSRMLSSADVVDNGFFLSENELEPSFVGLSVSDIAN